MAEEFFQLSFDEEKAAIAAANFVLRAGERGTINIMVLVKLLYILDRTAIIRRGHPVVGGRYGSMPFGPVHLNGYESAKGEAAKGIWSKTMSLPYGPEVRRESMPEDDLLSEWELDLIDEVAAEYGHMAPKILSDHTHKADEFPEWINPGQSMIPISWEDILRAGGKLPAEIDEIIRDAREMALMSRIFGG